MTTRKEYNRAYYETNLERERQRSLDYYYENKDKIDREKKKEYMRKYLKTYKRKPKTSEEKSERSRKRRERYAQDAEYREKVKQQVKDRNHRNPTLKRSSRLKEEFGINLQRYNEILETQGGGCAICGVKQTGVREENKAERSLSVDHDHQTGLVRGLLCHRCNFGIGQFQDDPSLLIKAAQYLTSYRGES